MPRPSDMRTHRRIRYRLTSLILAAALLWGQAPQVQAAGDTAAVRDTEAVRETARLTSDTEAEEGTTLVIPDGTTEIGDSAYAYTTQYQHVIIPDSVKKIGKNAFRQSSIVSVEMGDGVEEIGERAFYGCSRLTRAELSESLVSVDYAAFQSCEALEEVRLPAGLRTLGSSAFEYCSSLRRIELPGGLSDFDGAFRSSGLEAVELGEGITEIPQYAFYNCLSLKQVTFPGSLVSVGDNAFGYSGLEELVLPDTVEVLGDYSFQSCSQLTRVVFPEGLTQIGQQAFYRCGSLTEVLIPDSVTKLGRQAFEECTGLTSLEIGDGVEVVDYDIVKKCSALKELTLGKSVRTFNRNRELFEDCSALERIWVDEENPYYHSDDHGMLYDTQNRILVQCPAAVGDSRVTVEEGTVRIRDYAFKFCYELEEVILPDTVTEIGVYAFEENHALAVPDFPAGLTKIGNYAFKGCRSFTELSLPEGLESIGESAFTGCTSLNRVIIPAGTVSVGRYAFEDCPVTYAQLPGSLTAFEYLFEHNTDLTDVVLEEGLTSVARSAFRGCTDLARVEFPQSLTSVYYYAFADSGLTEAVLPDSVTRLWPGAFENCVSLERVEFPSELQDIAEAVFLGGVSLTEADLSGCSSLGRIANQAFENCTSLQAVMLPENLDTLGNGAFRNCTLLKELTVYSEKVSLGQYRSAFEGCTALETIRGISGSAAEDYAAEMGIAFVSIGEASVPELTGMTVSLNRWNETSKNVDVRVSVSGESVYEAAVLEYSHDGIRFEEYERQDDNDERQHIWRMIIDGPDYDRLYLRVVLYNDTASAVSETAELEIDTERPPVPGNFTASADESYIHLGWSYNEVPSDFGEFRVYRGLSPDGPFEQIGALRSIGFYDTDIETGGTYYYYMTAVDQWGHISEQTPVISETYLDEEAPYVSSSTPGENETQYESMRLGFGAGDNWRLASARLSFRRQGTESYTLLSEYELSGKSDTFYYNWDISGLESGYYEVLVELTDGSGLTGRYTYTFAVEQYEEMQTPQPEAVSGFKEVSLTWDACVSDRLLAGYAVYRQPADGSGSLVKVAEVREPEYTDRVNPGSYDYVVEVRNIFGDRLRGTRITADSLSNDSEPPKALASPGEAKVWPGAAVSFDASASSDNDEILSWHWDFGDGSEAEGVTAEHVYEEKGSFEAVLTVTDVSGNASAFAIPVEVAEPDAASGKRAVALTVTDDSTGEVISGAQLILEKADGAPASAASVTAVTDENGNASVVLDGDQTYRMVVVKQNSEYQAEERELYVEPPTDDPEPQKEDVALSRVHFLVGELTAKELSAEEIADAGIDTEDPMNREVTEFTLVLVYQKEEPVTLPITYYVNGAGGIVEGAGSGWTATDGPGSGFAGSVSSGGKKSAYYVAGVAKDAHDTTYVMVVNGGISWLKQMFEVSLVVVNTSEEDWVEGASATLNLPEGMSLAGMTEEAGEQTMSIALDRLGPGEQKNATWYVRGDEPGSYDLSADVTGTYYPEPAENFRVRFATAQPVEVVDTSDALSLHVGNIPRHAANGQAYPLTFTLTNNSDRTLNYVNLSLKSDHLDKTFEVTTLEPGQSETFEYNLVILAEGEELDTELKLRDVIYVCGGRIPITFSYSPEAYDVLQHEMSLYTDEEEPVKVERFRYSMGSYSFETRDETSTGYDHLYLRSQVTNPIPEGGVGSRAENVSVKITAPEGFSFREYEIVTEYEYTIDAIEIGASSPVREIDLYPIYHAEGDLPEEAEFSYQIRADRRQELADTYAVPVEINPDMGRIPYRATAAVSSRVTSEAVWGQDDLGYYPNQFAESFAESSTSYRRGIAALSLYLSSSVYRYDDIREALLNLGFFDIQGYAFNPADTDEVQETLDQDSVANVVASKKLIIDGEVCVLVAVIVRGTVGQEWYGNFNVGTGSEHASFYQSCLDVEERLAGYMSEAGIPREKTKLLVTGHSRGAAAANLLAAELDGSLTYADQEDIYVYTYATPNVTRKSGTDSSAYDNIFNIINPKDLVACVPLPEWGYGKYGITLSFPEEGTSEYHENISGARQVFAAITGVTQATAYGLSIPGNVDAVRGILSELAPTVEDYENRQLVKVEVSDLFKTILSWQLASVSNPVFGGILSGMTPLYKACYERLAGIVDQIDGATVTPHDVGNAVAAATLSIPAQIQRPVSFSHAVETYISWLHTVDPEPVRSMKNGRLITANCPVDLEIYDAEGNLAGRVTDGRPDLTIENRVSAVVTADSKSVWLPGEDPYSIVFTGTGEGVMTYTVAEYDETGTRVRQMVFRNIPLTEGCRYTETLGGAAGAPAEDYALRAPEGTLWLPDADLKGEALEGLDIQVRITGQGDVSGSGSCAEGDYVTLTALAVPGYRFEGWYIDGQLVSEAQEYAFVAAGNLLLEARFTSPLTIPDPDEVYHEGMTLGDIALPDGWEWLLPETELISGENGHLAIYTPSAGEVSVCESLAGWDSGTGTVTALIPVTLTERLPFPFKDVAENDWYYDAVDYVYQRNIMTGMGTDRTFFAPLDILCRAQFVTVLWRMEGEQEAEMPSVFPDVRDSDWYADAVIWANENRIATGYSNGYFGPADNITREQMAVMMQRYARYLGYAADAQTDISGYEDAGKVSEFAEEAMQWAVAEGIISGKYNQTQLDPQGNTSRAECAVIIMRFMQTYGL